MAPVTEHPDWPWYAVLGAFAGRLLFGSVGFRNVRLAVPSFALGNGYAIACMGTLPMLYDNWLRLDAAVNLLLQAVFAVHGDPPGGCGAERRGIAAGDDGGDDLGCVAARAAAREL